MTVAPAAGATVVLASRNAGKVVELRRILAAGGLDLQVRSSADYPDMPDVVESGATFAENSLLKAVATARFTGLPAIADDSGLCVDALNSMPGVLSARWAGRSADDGANLQLVLDQIADVPDERRAAQFRCAAAVAVPRGDDTAQMVEHVVEGQVAGRLLRERRGDNGFGYDPIFLPTGGELTTAQMTPQAKDAISHRGRALRSLVAELPALLSG